MSLPEEISEELITVWDETKDLSEVAKRLRIFLDNFKDEIKQNRVVETENLSEYIKFIRGN